MPDKGLGVSRSPHKQARVTTDSRHRLFKGRSRIQWLVMIDWWGGPVCRDIPVGGGCAATHTVWILLRKIVEYVRPKLTAPLTSKQPCSAS